METEIVGKNLGVDELGLILKQLKKDFRILNKATYRIASNVVL